MEDSNPAYESANIDRNPNQIDDYDYMWNHDNYNFMGGTVMLFWKASRIQVYQESTSQIRKNSRNGMYAIKKAYKNDYWQILPLLCILLCNSYTKLQIVV